MRHGKLEHSRRVCLQIFRVVSDFNKLLFRFGFVVFFVVFFSAFEPESELSLAGNFGPGSEVALCRLLLAPLSLPSSGRPSILLPRVRPRTPSSKKRPLVRLRPRGDVSSSVTGAPPGSLSARCVVFTVPFCLITISLFVFGKSTAWSNGSVGTEYGQVGYTVRSLVCRLVRRLFRVRIALRVWGPLHKRLPELSVLGEDFDHTPMVIPIWAHLDSVKKLLKGGVYIGRVISAESPL